MKLPNICLWISNIFAGSIYLSYIFHICSIDCPICPWIFHISNLPGSQISGSIPTSATRCLGPACDLFKFSSTSERGWWLGRSLKIPDAAAGIFTNHFTPKVAQMIPHVGEYSIEHLQRLSMYLTANAVVWKSRWELSDLVLLLFDCLNHMFLLLFVFLTIRITVVNYPSFCTKVFFLYLYPNPQTFPTLLCVCSSFSFFIIHIYNTPSGHLTNMQNPQCADHVPNGRKTKMVP